MKKLILVDACNLLHRWPAYRSRLGEGIDALAQELLAQLRSLHDLDHWELHLIVDGKGPSLTQDFADKSRTLSLLFCPAHHSADTIIESWLLKLGPDWKVVVVTEDRAIAHTALAQGAEPMTASQVFDWVDRLNTRYARQQDQQLKKSSARFGNRLEGLP